MRNKTLFIRLLFVALTIGLVGCRAKTNTQKTDKAAPTAAKKADPRLQVPPPPHVDAPPPEAEKTPSGLASMVLKPGTGTDKPNVWDKVEVYYTGWTTNGKTFDSTLRRNKSATFGLKQVIPGWTEGLQLMTVGEERRFWIPVELAYQNKPGKPKGMLVFDVEIIRIIPGPKPIPAPADVAAPPADAKKTASGLAYKVLAKGTSKERPTLDDKVETHYTGWTTDGEMFDSSVQRGRPAIFPLGSVIKGWTEGLQLMTVGEKTRFWIPVELAYNNRPGKPKGMLVFDVELIKIMSAPKSPSDVAAPPASAKKTASGLAYRVLQKGTGTRHPTKADRVKVHYSGWTTDGKMFDSSVQRGSPSSFGLGQVIAGWTEGLQLMVKGEKTRFWIPVDLAYQNRPGRPGGMLVFDVELLEIL